MERAAGGLVVVAAEEGAAPNNDGMGRVGTRPINPNRILNAQPTLARKASKNVKRNRMITSPKFTVPKEPKCD